MSLFTAMSSATSGIESSSTDLSVIGNNIANASTVGFKQGRADFETALSQTLIGGNGQVGLGSDVATVQTIMTEGSLTNTGNTTDLALQGNGFFVLSGSYAGQQGTFYTRDGQFTVDKNGYLVTQQGLQVQGFQANAAGVLSGVPSSLQVGNVQAQPVATANVTLKANLDASATVPPAWDPANPTTTSNFSSSVTVYDSLGSAHAVQIFFRNTGGGWEWHAMADGGGLTGGTAGTLTEIANGTLTFNSNGALTAYTQASNFNPLGATNPQALNFDFGNPIGANGSTTGITQFAATSATTFVGQDGYSAGQLSSIQVGQNGQVSGVFSNGQTRLLGQVAVAGFQANDQLTSIGGNLYDATPAAGQAVVGAPGSGGLGSITSGALEQSNVDLSTQLVDMIAAQRAFEANSKTITTADTLLSELIQMKR
ncbi:MAG TPA: flagellar hook protein FlgE [Anaeromyxobacteraceae bacterium]|nr:flagellar hook protein FlgE [Anaeromyxobacteraceae bacterium]